MAKKVVGQIKLQLPAGKATPAPPVGPALGQHGVNIMEFCKQFNAKTSDQAGLVIPAVITALSASPTKRRRTPSSASPPSTRVASTPCFRLLPRRRRRPS